MRRWRIRTIATSITLSMLGMGSADAQCQVGILYEPSGDPENTFGIAAMEGDVAVVGDPNWPEPGRAWIYRRIDGEWQLAQQLLNPFTAAADTFGTAIALSGDLAVIGAPRADGDLPSQGVAHVYRWRPGPPTELGEGVQGEPQGEWVYEARLLAFDGDMLDRFGHSVAVGGSVIAIGARDDEHHGEAFAGSVYIFRHDGQQWRHEAKLVDPGGEEGDAFGGSVAIRDRTLVVGARGNDDAGFGTGAAFVFEQESPGSAPGPHEWELEAQLTAADAKWQAWFGTTVALSTTADGQLIAIGAPEDDGQNGAVYIFRRESFRAPHAWVQEAKLTGSEPMGPFPRFGAALSLSQDGRTLIVGAPLDYAAAVEGGAAYLFKRAGTDWKEIDKLVARDGPAVVHFGAGVATDDDWALIRSPSGSDELHVFAGVGGNDCDGDGTADLCEILSGTARDDDGDGIPDDCQDTPVDVNGDGDIDFTDLLIILHSWGPCPPKRSCVGDIDQDGSVGISDLLLLLAYWAPG